MKNGCRISTIQIKSFFVILKNSIDEWLASIDIPFNSLQSISYYRLSVVCYHWSIQCGKKDRIPYISSMNFLKGNRKWHWIFWGVYFLINLFTLHNAGTAYVTLDWWIPKFYNKGKYPQFIIVTFSTIVIFSILLTASLLLLF